MTPPIDTSSHVRAEAAAWLARLRADNKTAEDERAFHVWLARDARHAAAFEAVTEIWELTGAAGSQPPILSNTSNRRALLAGIGSLAAAGVMLTLLQQASAATYETAVGEQKHAALPDGSQAFLDTDTKLRVHFDGQTRQVVIEKGRCNFRVRDTGGHPFVVDVAAQHIQAERGSFDVRRDGDNVCVVLAQGTVTVGPMAGVRQTLVSGDRFFSGPHGSVKDRPNLTPILAWQTGQIVFDNETVAGAIREMNRYSVVKITTDDTAVGNMRISGVYRIGDNVAFAHSVAALLPVILDIDTNRVRLELDTAKSKRT